MITQIVSRSSQLLALRMVLSRPEDVVEIVGVPGGGLFGVDDVRDDKAVRQILDCLRVEVDLVGVEV